MRRTPAPACIIIPLMLSGCASGPPPAHPEPPPTAARPIAPPAPATVELAGVVIEDAGAEPRRTLQFEPQPGWRGLDSANFKIHIVNTEGRREAVIARCSFNEALEVVVENTTPTTGKMRSRLMAPPTVTDLGGDPEWTAEFQHNFRAVQSEWQTTQIDPHNESVFESFALERGPRTDGSDGEMLKCGTFLPRSAVGAGARWVYTASSADTSTRFEARLTQLRPDAATIEYTLTRDSTAPANRLAQSSNDKPTGHTHTTETGTCQWKPGLPAWEAADVVNKSISTYDFTTPDGRRWTGELRATFEIHQALRPFPTN